MIRRITHLMLIMLLTLCSTNSHAKIHDSANYLDNLFTEQAQQEIDAGFAITETFIQQTSQFMADRARESDTAQQQLDNTAEEW